MNTIDRLSDRYKIDLDTGCFVWMASKNNNGYGQLTINGKTCKASRLMWMMVNGDIPDGMHVLHKCDNPACVNPDHLFLGTHNENMSDKVAKNRQSRTGNKVYALKTHLSTRTPIFKRKFICLQKSTVLQNLLQNLQIKL